MLRTIIISIFSLFSFFCIGAETRSSSALFCSNIFPIFNVKGNTLPDEIPYPRDNSFPLKHAGGHQYIPYQFLESKSGEELISITEVSRAAILGYYMDTYGREFGQLKKEVIGTVGELFGAGFKNGQVLINFLKRNNIKYKDPGLTAIEGGNIHFITHKGKTKAIIGDHSLIMTIISDLFDDHFPDFTADQFKLCKTHPKYMLRNLDIAKLLNLGDFLPLFMENSKEYLKKYDEYLQKYTSPILNYLDKSRAKHANENLSHARYLIAKELELEVDDLIIIPQRKYHIDMDLFITPQGKIVLRSPNSNAERKIWEKQYAILERCFSKDNIIDVHEKFSDPALFCGILDSERNNNYVYIALELHDDFNQFIADSLGLRPVWYPGDLSDSNAGAHCLVQEYIYNIKQPILCATCNTPEPKFKCSRCKKVWYCNADCQSTHWPEHVKACKDIVTSKKNDG